MTEGIQIMKEKIHSIIQQICIESLLCAMHCQAIERWWEKSGHYLCSPWSLKSGKEVKDDLEFSSVSDSEMK